MRNITLALDDGLLEAAREFAQKNGTTVNALVRRLLEQSVRPPTTAWFDELESLALNAGGDSGGRRWTREELHDRGGVPD